MNPQSKMALISVSDKTGIVEFSNELSQLGYEILSTGGTAKALNQAEIPVREVKDFTKFPEILEGRVKTLHPKIFGGILYKRDNPKHKADMDQHDLEAIDCVVVNLYPFEKIHLENKIPKEEMIEFIDIGGVSLLRAAAKNFAHVIVLCDSADYKMVIEELKENKEVSLATRTKLAQKAFSHTAHYDSMIAKYFIERSSQSEIFPKELTIGLKKVCDLRYGENPQQKASLYKESGARAWGITDAEVLQGKELSFNNYLDVESAWEIVNSLVLSRATGERELSTGSSNPCCVIIKHTNPCGVAMGQSLGEAFQLSFAADPVSAFGGVIGFSHTVDEETANLMLKSFFECVIAPDFSNGALELFKKKPNLRVLRQKTTLTLPFEFDIKKISGGYLLQERDLSLESLTPASMGAAKEIVKLVTKRTATMEELYSLDFAWRVSKHVKSNAIVLAKGTVTKGIGTGQTSRVDSLKIAINKAGLKLPETVPALLEIESPQSKLPLVMASDGFFPFRDCVDEAAKVGVSAIVQPGGSIRDQESIDAANEQNIAMIFTGTRHFRH